MTDTNHDIEQTDSSGRTIAVGDIHGCAQALERLLAVVELTSQDTIVFLGDYVDRGPNSKRVMEIMIELNEQFHVIPLLGNHEIMMLDAAKESVMRDLWRLQFGGQQTLESYGGDLANIPTEHLDFMRQCLPFYETDDHLFVHANYLPGSPLVDQEAQIRYWTHLLDFQPGPHKSGKRVIVGHTPQTHGNILDFGHLVCIDTYCFGGGNLTALDVSTNEIWQAKENE
jgi:serine/threonine protein phosphatase 1